MFAKREVLDGSIRKSIEWENRRLHLGELTVTLVCSWAIIAAMVVLCSPCHRLTPHASPTTGSRRNNIERDRPIGQLDSGHRQLN